MAKRLQDLGKKEIEERIQRLVDFRTRSQDKYGAGEFEPALKSMLRMYRRRLKKLITQKGK